MNVQLIHSDNGKPAGVFIPIKDWENIQKKYPKLVLKPKKEAQKTAFIKSFKQAFDELQLVLDGKLQARPLKEVLDEL